MAHDSLAQLDPSRTVITVVDRLSNRLLLNKVAVIEHALLDLKVLVLTQIFYMVCMTRFIRCSGQTSWWLSMGKLWPMACS